ncbi:hypothetical protein THAOC_33933, partial [Thalassiosira oceanica]
MATESGQAWWAMCGQSRSKRRRMTESGLRVESNRAVTVGGSWMARSPLPTRKQIGRSGRPVTLRYFSKTQARLRVRVPKALKRVTLPSVSSAHPSQDLCKIGALPLPTNTACVWALASVSGPTRQRGGTPGPEKGVISPHPRLGPQPAVAGKDVPTARSGKRLKCWKEGNIAGLVQDLVNQALQRVGAGRPTVDPEKKNRVFNSTVLNGQIRKGVRNLTDRGGGGVLQPDDKCTKTDRPVIEVLEEKHPEMQMPDLTDRT